MSVLVLNSQYLPIQTTTIQKAIKLIFRGVAQIEKYSDKVWKSVSNEIVLPTVIRLINFHSFPKRTYRLSKKNICVRDKYTCQYCSVVLSEKSLTVDHIIPKSKGGSDKWENLVSACKSCNLRKADKRPEEVGMKLLSKPSKISIHTHTTIIRNKGLNNPDWTEFLFN